LIFHFYAFAIISYWNSHKIIFLFFNNQLYYSFSVSKFYGIGEKVQENLLKSFHVCFHLKVVLEIVEIRLDFYGFHINFVLENVLYFSNCKTNVKNCEVLGKILVLFAQNSVVEDIMDKIVDELGRWDHFLSTLVDLFIYFFKFFELLSRYFTLGPELSQDMCKLFEITFYRLHLYNQGV
jgi:hypothetical protein